MISLRVTVRLRFLRARMSNPDPTAKEGDWSAFDIRALKNLKRTVTLKEIKDDPDLQEIHLVRNSRLSVMPIEAKDFKHLLDLAQTSV